MNIDIVFLKDIEIYEELFQKAFAAARSSISIATANLKDVHVETGAGFSSIVELFEQIADKVIEIRLLHSGVPSASFLQHLKGSKLIERGKFSIRRCPRVHFKAVIIDAKTVFIGSPNLTGAGMGAKGRHRRNFELGILSASEQLVDRVSEFFNAIWEGKMCGDCKRMNVCPAPLGEPGL